MKRIGRAPQIEQLLDRKKEILNKRYFNQIWAQQVRRNYWVANTQNLHNTYVSEMVRHLPRQMPPGGLPGHRARLERMLREDGMWRDPSRGISEPY